MMVIFGSGLRISQNWRGGRVVICSARYGESSVAIVLEYSSMSGLGVRGLGVFPEDLDLGLSVALEPMNWQYDEVVKKVVHVCCGDGRCWRLFPNGPCCTSRSSKQRNISIHDRMLYGKCHPALPALSPAIAIMRE